MTSDDALVSALAVLMHQVDHGELPPAPRSGVAELDAEAGPVTVDLATYEAAHRASQWESDTPPRVLRRGRA